MNSNQIVSHSLTESLKEFPKAIAPFLELGKVEQWDGRTLLQREEKIREAALRHWFREMGQDKALWYLT